MSKVFHQRGRKVKALGRLLKVAVVSLLVCMGMVSVLKAWSQSGFDQFVTAKGDQLLDGDRPLRFISWNIPNLLMIEDNVPFAETNSWRLPDRFELTDALATVRQMGGLVARTYVITVRRTNETAEVPRHVLGPGQFNEDAFRAVDLALQVANEQGIRLIIPLVDNWSWQGGRAEYAGFRGKTKDEFWTDPQVIQDFKETIRFIVTRTNVLTGTRYSDDKAILCWETGNELQSPPSWTSDIAAYIKSLDTNHLVMDGYHTSELRPESLEMDAIDIVTTHHYPGSAKSFARLIRENAAKAKGHKPYVVGEFGFVGTDQIREAIEAMSETQASGGLLWSLRFRNRDGGFYWHSEPAGGNLYKAFHWPGSDIGSAYDEVTLMRLVRDNAYRIQERPLPLLPVPDPPILLPATNGAFLSWRGSVGASSYDVERGRDPDGPWTVVGHGVMEDAVQYRPLFVDETAPKGTVYYRVIGRNESGSSAPSNVVGPVESDHRTFVDELDNLNRTHSHSGKWQIESRDCRQAKEDAHRAAGQAGSTLVYQLPTPIKSVRVFVFFPKDIADPSIALSVDGNTYQRVEVERDSFFDGAGDYGYWKPVEYRVAQVQSNARMLRIELKGDTQIGRVEIDHEFD